MAKPLQWVTEQLREQVVCFHGHVGSLKSNKSVMPPLVWEIALEKSSITSHNVVLALGAQPKSLNQAGVPEISVTDALIAKRSSQCFLATDTVAVFGSSHSAIMNIRSLIEEFSVKRVVNFYRTNIRYAEYLDGWIRYDDTGLKGLAAQ